MKIIYKSVALIKKEIVSLNIVNNLNKTTMKIQDLKNNRKQIIEKINELGVSDVKTFMELLVMDVDFFKGDNVLDLVNEVFNTHFRERAKRSDFLANSIAKGREVEESKGNIWNPITSSWEKAN